MSKLASMVGIASFRCTRARVHVVSGRRSGVWERMLCSGSARRFLVFDSKGEKERECSRGHSGKKRSWLGLFVSESVSSFNFKT